MATVRQSGGDYATLAAALAAGEPSIEIDRPWSVPDTAPCTFIANSTITVSGGARHTGRWNESAQHYRLVVTDANAITIPNSITSAVIDGLSVHITGNTTADRRGISATPGGGNAIQIRNSLIRSSGSAEIRECVRVDGFLNGSISLENCMIWGAGRYGVRILDPVDGFSVTLNLNSCTIYGCGVTETGGGVRSFSTGVASTSVIQLHNTIVVGNTANGSADVSQGGTLPATWNISNSIDSDGSIANVLDAGSGNLLARTPVDSQSAGVGDWVIFRNITAEPFDLRLLPSDASRFVTLDGDFLVTLDGQHLSTIDSDNDAVDMHAVDTAHGLTIPSADISGKQRPQGFGHDCGAFELGVITHIKDKVATLRLRGGGLARLHTESRRASQLHQLSSKVGSLNV